MENSNRRLRELKGSDFKIVDGQPDIKGWSLYDAQHRKLGEVEDLLFDQQMRKVRYIIADLDGNDFDLDSKEVLIPIGIAELHETDDEVILPGVTSSQLSALPEYNDDREITDVDENAISAVFTDAGTTAYEKFSGSDSDRYNHAHFDDQRIYRTRNTNSNRTTDDDTFRIPRENFETRNRDVDSDRDINFNDRDNNLDSDIRR